MGERLGGRRCRLCGRSAGWLSALVGSGWLLLLGASTALAEPGDLDGSFSRDGRVLTDIANGNDAATAVAIQPDGKIVAAGFSSPPRGARRFALARYDPDGSRDLSFGNQGVVMTRFGDESAAQSVAIQPDGKIVAAGMASRPETGWDFAVARYDGDGTLDGSFSGDGRLATDFAGGADGGHALALRPDGKLVVAGESEGNFALARYEPDGDLDTSLSGDGLATTDFDGQGDGAYALALQPAGKLVLAGFATEPSGFGDWVPAVARYESDGDLDPSFSDDGRATVDPLASGLQGNAAYGLVARQGGSLVLAGRWGLLGFAADGSPDASFGDGGRAAPLVSDLRGLAVQPDGALVGAGSTGDFQVGRWSSSGALDSFGDVPHSSISAAGAVTDFGLFRTDEARAVAIQQDGKVVAAGRSAAGYDEPGDFALARYRVDRTTPADADADGIADSRDLCPRRYAIHEPDGCPHYSRSVTIRYSDREGAFKGHVRSPQRRCKRYPTRVVIFKREHSGDVRIHGTGYPPGYSVPADPRPGRYYAQVRGSFWWPDLLGICQAARSPLVRVKQ